MYRAGIVLDDCHMWYRYWFTKNEKFDDCQIWYRYLLMYSPRTKRSIIWFGDWRIKWNTHTNLWLISSYMLLAYYMFHRFVVQIRRDTRTIPANPMFDTIICYRLYVWGLYWLTVSLKLDGSDCKQFRLNTKQTRLVTYQNKTPIYFSPQTAQPGRIRLDFWRFMRYLCTIYMYN